MEIDRDLQGMEKVKPLTDEASDHPGEYVPCPSRGHSWIARRIDEDLTLWSCNQGAISFEDQIEVIGLGKTPADADPIILDFF